MIYSFLRHARQRNNCLYITKRNDHAVSLWGLGIFFLFVPAGLRSVLKGIVMPWMSHEASYPTFFHTFLDLLHKRKDDSRIPSLLRPFRLSLSSLVLSSGGQAHQCRRISVILFFPLLWTLRRLQVSSPQPLSFLVPKSLTVHPSRVIPAGRALKDHLLSRALRI